MLKKVKGLTLIELMVVIAVAAILAAVSIPSFYKIIERQQLRQAAEALKSDMQLARTEAIKRSADIIVVRNTGTDGSWCYGASTVTCDCTETVTTEADYCSIYRVTGEQYNSTDISSVSANTTFGFRRGTANTSNTCIQTTNFSLKVLVQNTGGVEVCSDVDAPVGGYEACSTNTCAPAP